MASSTKPVKEKPLSFMENLSSLVSLYRPSSNVAEAESGGPAPPKLIIIASWTNALDSHIAKYVNKYRELYPSSQILLVRSTSKVLFDPPLLNKTVQHLVPVIRAIFPSDASSSSPGLLIHLLSNGGSSSISNLYNAYAASARDGEDRHLPQHVTIFDSAPGVFTVSGTVAYFQVGLSTIQRAISTPFLYAASLFWAAAISVGVFKDWPAYWGTTHNEGDGKTTSEIRRAYIYSDTDALIHHESVEAHAADAEKKGFQVRREKFDGSAHVSHARKDEARYWEVVKNTWGGL
ncbi:hypothetical protein FDECE_17017 [Fusarium decemcellulare]|nr:hypothetical protein FDECE_17017 [Fusarium decemcellulare]